MRRNLKEINEFFKNGMVRIDKLSSLTFGWLIENIAKQRGARSEEEIDAMAVDIIKDIVAGNLSELEKQELSYSAFNDPQPLINGCQKILQLLGE